MQGLQRLLLHAFDAHRDHFGAARRFDQRRGIGCIGLVALDVGAHVLSRQQLDRDTHGRKPAAPVVRAAARLHHHQADRAVGKPALELAAGEPCTLDDAPLRIGHGQLEYALGKVNTHDRKSSSSIHLGLPFGDVALTPTPHEASWHDDAVTKPGGVHSISRERS